MLLNSLLVAIGGFLGAISRFAVSRLMARVFPSPLPLGTLTVNLTGSLMLGLIAGWGLPHLYLLFGTGFMGAFTTFSTFKLESIQMHAAQKWSALVAYLLISYTAGIALAYIGYRIGTAV